MRANRNQRMVRRARVSLVTRLRKTFSRHLKDHLSLYVPAVLPMFLFFLAHGITLLMLILLKSGALPQGFLLHKTVVTWAVYGILPLLLCSYGCFFAVARPATGILERKFSDWAPAMLNLVVGALYGAAIGFVLFALLEPRSTLRVLLLLVIGLVTGLGNWLLYRRLTYVATPATDSESQQIPGRSDTIAD